jgi:HPt (histidine-containing phosphotransfer) domain-containing protein
MYWQSVSEDQPRAQAPAAADFDATDLLDRVMGDRVLAEALVRAFLDEVPQQISELRLQYRRGDAAAIAYQAHSLKGAAASISAEALSGAAAELERAGKRGVLTEVASMVPRVEREWDRFRIALRRNGWAPVTNSQ